MEHKKEDAFVGLIFPCGAMMGTLYNIVIYYLAITLCTKNMPEKKVYCVKDFMNFFDALAFQSIGTYVGIPYILSEYQDFTLKTMYKKNNNNIAQLPKFLMTEGLTSLFCQCSSFQKQVHKQYMAILDKGYPIFPFATRHFALNDQKSELSIMKHTDLGKQKMSDLGFASSSMPIGLGVFDIPSNNESPQGAVEKIGTLDVVGSDNLWFMLKSLREFPKKIHFVFFYISLLPLKRKLNQVRLYQKTKRYHNYTQLGRFNMFLMGLLASEDFIIHVLLKGFFRRLNKTIDIFCVRDGHYPLNCMDYRKKYFDSCLSSGIDIIEKNKEVFDNFAKTVHKYKTMD